MVEYVIGIDGGGTKTRGVMATLEGEIVAHTIVGSTNYHSVGLEVVEQRIRQIIEQLAGDEWQRKVGYICLGLSGVGREIDFERVGVVLEHLQIKEKSYLTNDAVIALIGGALSERGILVIAGTGSIVYGMDGKGGVARAGGYGQFLGDEGSGYRLGLKGLRAVMKAFDGRAPETSITKPVLEKLKLESPMQLVTWIGGLANVKEEVGKLAPVVLWVAEQGDQASCQIVSEEIEELILAIRAVVKKLGLGETEGGIDVVLCGGVLEKSIYYFNLLSEAIRSKVPGCKPVQPKAPAVIGAVIGGLKKLGVAVNEKVLKNLLESWDRISQGQT